MPARIAAGSFGHAEMTAAKSASIAAVTNRPDSL
jgi:hypothetical protein